MNNRRPIRILKFGLLALIAFPLFGLLVMSLWNWLMPAVFALHPITFWQAIGVFFLSRLLFGGFARGCHQGRHWRHRMMERWEQMTPEERARFREEMRPSAT